MAQPMRGDFAVFDTPQREALEVTFDRFVALLPGGSVEIAWGMPTIKVGTTAVASLWGFDRHNSVFPGPQVITMLQEDLTGHTTTKGTIHFERDKPMDKALVKKIALAGVQAINDRYPKKDGSFVEYYDNGYCKQRGKYREGQMHGKWSWWRRDGSLMRTGEFRDGEKTGSWVTYTREGEPR